MPKRRSSRGDGGARGPGGGAGVAALADEAADRAFADAASGPSGLEEEGAAEAGEADAGRAQVPLAGVLAWLRAMGRAEAADAVERPDRARPLAQADVVRFNELWRRFESGRELEDPDLAELYAMSLRRLALGRSRFEQARRQGGAALPPEYDELAARVRASERVAAEMSGRFAGFAPTGQIEEAARVAREALERAEGHAEFCTLDPRDLARNLSADDRGRLRALWGRLASGEDLPEADLARLYALAASEAEEARASLQEALVSGLPVGDTVERFARREEAMERVRAVEAAGRARGRRFQPLADPVGDTAAEHVSRLLARQGDLAPGGGVPESRGAERLAPPPQQVPSGGRRVAFVIAPGARAGRLREHLAACGIAALAPGDPVPDGAVAVNYGGASREVLRGAARAAERLNAPFAVRDASDKLRAVRLLGDLAPRTAGDPALVAGLGSEYVVAKRSRGSRGEGKELFRVADLERDPALRRRLLRYDHFQEYISNREEYRVNLLGDEVLTAYRKVPPEGEGPRLGGHRGFELQRSLPRAAAEAAREARRRVGLDLAGVDLLYDRTRGRWFVLEVNAAPGMGPATLRRFLESVGGSERAPD